MEAWEERRTILLAQIGRICPDEDMRKLLEPHYEDYMSLEVPGWDLSPHGRAAVLTKNDYTFVEHQRILVRRSESPTLCQRDFTIAVASSNEAVILSDDDETRPSKRQRQE
jgi:hypothetical protein